MQQQQLMSAPVGIDLGSYKSKIAVAKRGGVEVITNEANFRQTPCVVGYGPAERQIGEAGAIKMKSNFRDSIVAPQRFLGLPFNYPMLRAETKFSPARSSIEGNKIQFQVKYQGQKESLVPEQITAAYLNKMKLTVLKNGFENKEAVVAVPPYLTQSERKAFLNSAKIAELNVTRLINDSTAIALDYGMFRKGDLESQNARQVLFIDFGHSKFSVFCCSFTKQEMNVLYQEYQRHIGCRDLDYLMYEFYRGHFEKISGGCDLAENRKAVLKIMENIEKQRKVLSGNSEFEMNIEYLMEENDLQYSMKRDQFEQISNPVFNQIHDILLRTREKLKEKGIKIHSVELVGGGTRIPKFLQIAKEIFGIELSRTLNSSQSVARGCALMAAIRSPLFKVPQYHLHEKVAYGIKFSWNFVEGNNFLGMNSELYPEKQRKMIFDQGSKIPSSKTIKFTRKQAIEILIEYEPTVVGFNKVLGYYITKEQKPSKEQFGVTFKLKHNENGVVTFDECSLYEEWTEEVKVPKKKQKKEEPKEANKQGGQVKPEEKEEKEEFQIKKNKKERYTQIKYDVNEFDTFNEKEIQNFFSIECSMLNQDRILIETYERKNELESLTYSWKEKLCGSHQEFGKPEEISGIISFLESINEWLYGDGQQSNRGTYINKINEVKEKVGSIQKKYDNFEAIKNQIATLISCMKYNYDWLSSQDKKYEHISAAQRQEVLALIQRTKGWMKNAEQKQSKRAKWEETAVSVEELKKCIREINDKTQSLMNKPAPKVEEPKKEEPGKSEKEGVSAENNEMEDEAKGKDQKIEEEK